MTDPVLHAYRHLQHWLPALRAFGIMGINMFKDIVVLNGSGVGGGSLVYAGVMLRPNRAFFQAGPGGTWPIGKQNWRLTTIRPNR